jgi:precorrin-6Y C5,15-methyltransferase (decarboxylating)
MRNGRIQLIGVDLNPSASLPTTVLNDCHTIVISKRFEPLLAGLYPDYHRCEIVSITPLDAAISTILKRLDSGNVAVLATGDPLFFGIGKRLIDIFGADNTTVFPAPSSVQYTFSRFGISWDDSSFLSLHGRNEPNFVGTILAHRKIAILTDGRNRPEIIASALYQFLGEDEHDLTLYVAENLGMHNERLVTGTLQEIANNRFGSLCCMLAVRQPTLNGGLPNFGLSEDDITHSRGLITKSEVRAAAIHALRVPANAILWDVGAGSGSVSLEIARMIPDALVYSIERNTEQHENILANKRKYNVINQKLVKGLAPESLYGLPAPHRVFIGGSGGNLSEIIEYCSNQLHPGGRIVVTGVLEKTCREAPEYMYHAGLKVDTRRIQVQRNMYPPCEEQTFNPITIIVGQKS